MCKLLTCWSCGKTETYEGEFFVGQNPYAVEMSVTDYEREEVTDEEVLCDNCYSIACGDI